MTTFIFPDAVRGTVGNDVINLYDFAFARPNGGFHAFGRTGDDVIYGTSFDDGLNGQRGEDQLYGGYGNDTLNGYWGNDVLDGGPGTDYIYGGDGHDVIFGSDDTDVMFGGRGNDTIIDTSPGLFNTIIAGSGNDNVTVLSGWVDLGGGDDFLRIYDGVAIPGPGRDIITAVVTLDGVASSTEITGRFSSLDRFKVDLHDTAFNLASLDLDRNGRLDATDGALLGDTGDVRLGEGVNGMTASFRDGEVWDQVSLKSLSVSTDFFL